METIKIKNLESGFGRLIIDVDLKQTLQENINILEQFTIIQNKFYNYYKSSLGALPVVENNTPSKKYYGLEISLTSPVTIESIGVINQICEELADEMVILTTQGNKFAWDIVFILRCYNAHIIYKHYLRIITQKK